MATMNDTYDEAVANVIRRGYSDLQGSDTGNRWFQLHTADPTDLGGSRVTGVPRVAVALNEIQELAITGAPTGGTGPEIGWKSDDGGDRLRRDGGRGAGGAGGAVEYWRGQRDLHGRAAAGYARGD